MEEQMQAIYDRVNANMAITRTMFKQDVARMREWSAALVEAHMRGDGMAILLIATEMQERADATEMVLNLKS